MHRALTSTATDVLSRMHRRCYFKLYALHNRKLDRLFYIDGNRRGDLCPENHVKHLRFITTAIPAHHSLVVTASAYRGR